MAGMRGRYGRGLSCGAVALAAVLSACTGRIGDAEIQDGVGAGLSGGPSGETAVEQQTVPAPGGIRRLRARQYVNSIRLLLGAAASAAAKPPKDPQLHGLEAIAASELALSDPDVEAYETSARDIAKAAVADPSAIAPLLDCAPSGAADAACHRSFVARLGRLAFRRTLAADEIDRITAVAELASSKYGTFEAGLEHAILAILQSPSFLYLVEIGEPDEADPSRRRLSPLELAARMSFFLLDTTPDAALLDAAEAGELDDAEGIRAAARALLERTEARSTLATFYAELFKLRDLADVSKQPDLYPAFTPTLREAMKQETLRLVAHVVWELDGDARALLNAPYSFVNAELAGLYGVPPPAGEAFEKVTLPAAQGRAGLLGHAGLLARYAHPATTSPTRRGLFVRTTLLCETIPPPPPDVMASLPPDVPGKPQTMKQKLTEHMQNETCKSCHGLVDPIGLALERYDAIGAFRTTDQGLPIDTQVDVAGIGSFASAKELGDLLHDDPRAAACLVRNLFRASMGHVETPGEKPAMDALVAGFAERDHRVRELLVEICASPAFRLVGEPK